MVFFLFNLANQQQQQQQQQQRKQQQQIINVDIDYISTIIGCFSNG